jgi:hypothetical protein
MNEYSFFRAESSRLFKRAERGNYWVEQRNRGTKALSGHSIWYDFGR